MISLSITKLGPTSLQERMKREEKKNFKLWDLFAKQYSELSELEEEISKMQRTRPFFF